MEISLIFNPTRLPIHEEVAENILTKHGVVRFSAIEVSDSKMIFRSAVNDRSQIDGVKGDTEDHNSKCTDDLDKIHVTCAL